MDRRLFLKNVLGAIGAVTIAPALEPLAIIPRQEYIVTGKIWMPLAEYNAMLAFKRKQEAMLMWGTPITNKKEYENTIKPIY